LQEEIPFRVLVLVKGLACAIPAHLIIARLSKKLMHLLVGFWKRLRCDRKSRARMSQIKITFGGYYFGLSFPKAEYQVPN
jgi:hypothetical protein